MRIKTKFSSRIEGIHIWVNQPTRKIYTGNNNAFFSDGDNKAYSYGYHCLICQYLPEEDIFLLNGEKYSSTTNRAITEASRAIRYGEGKVFYVNFNSRYSKEHWDIDYHFKVQKERIEILQKEIENPRTKNKAGRASKIIGTIQTGRLLAEKLGYEWDISIDEGKLNVIIEEEKKKDLERTKKKEEKREAERIKILEEYPNLEKEYCDAWRKRSVSEDLSKAFRTIIGYLPYNICRLSSDGKQIETNAGARVSTDDARKLVVALERGEAIKGIKVGAFTVIGHSDDVIQIGCHKFRVDEAKYVKELLNGDKQLSQ